MRAKYESLQTELEYARRQTSADTAAVVAMTTRLDDADAERRRLEDDYQKLQLLHEDVKADERGKQDALKNEVTIMRNTVEARHSGPASNGNSLITEDIFKYLGGFLFIFYIGNNKNPPITDKNSGG